MFQIEPKLSAKIVLPYFDILLHFLYLQYRKHFCEFAEVCFWNFGDRMKHWITVNEPWSFASQGYATGNFPPCRGATTINSSETTKKSMTAEKSIPILNTILPHRTTFSTKNHSTKGDPGTEPYKVAHNLILSHAHAVRLYKQKYKVSTFLIINFRMQYIYTLRYSLICTI